MSFISASLPSAFPLLSLVADKAQGKNSNLIMGFYGGLKSLGGIFGSLAAGVLYTFNAKWPFALGTVAFALATLGSVYFYWLSKQDDVRQIAGVKQVSGD